MDKTEKKNKHFFVKIFCVVIIVCGTIFYSASFPVTMKLLDGNINKLLKSVGLKTEISIFEEFSELSERIINKTEFFVDTILGLLLVRGEDLEMQHLDIEKGILWIIGRVSSLSYLDEDTNKKKDEGFFKKLFK